MNEITIVLPTKDRHKLLRNCLMSLKGQGKNFKEIIIVDSSANYESKKTVTKFREHLNVKYIYEEPAGYPSAYNKGIKKAQGRWIAFLNDDCIVSKNWTEQLCRAIEKYPFDVIQGKSISVPKDNIYAAIMGDHYNNWVNSHLVKKLNLDTFDAKCSIIPKIMFYKKGKLIGFDERLIRGSEDIEMGQRLVQSGVKIIYYPKIVIYHKERTTLKGFVSQHWRIAQAEATLTKLTSFGNVSIFPSKKTKLNLISFLKREARYIKNSEIFNAVYLPFLYALLFFVRLFGYTLRR